MTPYDYTRSFVTFTTKGRGNNARLQIESTCTIHDKIAQKTTEYFFFASCKSEDTYAEKDLFYEHNYDFCGIFSNEEYVLFRTHATHTDGFREQGLWKDRFEDVQFHLVKQNGALLHQPTDIVQTTQKGTLLIGQVEIESPTVSATLEFPIKTMNVNDIDNLYQIDTGPVAYPDFDAKVERHIERLSPAFVAYNAPHFADFIIQHPLTISQNIQTTHYSKRESHTAKTAVIAIP